MFVVLRCLGRAVVANGLRALIESVPFIGDGLGKIAADTLAEWRRLKNQAECRDELAALVCAPAAEVRRQAEEVAAEVAPPEGREPLAAYLQQLPCLVRRSLTRREDPSGLSVPAGLPLDQPRDLLPFLPPRPPRFKVGDRPVGVGDWHLVELLGVGGFGEVWKATNPHRPGLAPVALKFCLDEKAAVALKNETALLDRVGAEGKHDGIVQLRHTYLSAEPPCLEYEYVAGGDLGTLIAEMHRAQSPALFDEITRLMYELCGIIAFAHRRNPPIVHRDLKPANILVERSPDARTLRVADFGIGGVAIACALTQTRLGTTPSDLMPTRLRGAYTPLYASEQQMNGGQADPRDDVYSLGVIWYQMLTGDLSKGRPSLGSCEDLGERGLAPDLVKLLLKCVEDERKHRPADAGAVQERLEAFIKPGAAGRGQLLREVEEKAQRIQEVHDRARALEKAHDYAGAVAVLDALPPDFQHLRDDDLYTRLCRKRDRVVELDQQARTAAAALRLDSALRRVLDELAKLAPEHELLPLRKRCPRSPTAREVIEAWQRAKEEAKKLRLERLKKENRRLREGQRNPLKCSRCGALAWQHPGVYCGWCGATEGTPRDILVTGIIVAAIGICGLSWWDWWVSISVVLTVLGGVAMVTGTGLLIAAVVAHIRWVQGGRERGDQFD
jgi:serine/threonine protein kinase